jgi:hypothetical protein
LLETRNLRKGQNRWVFALSHRPEFEITRKWYVSETGCFRVQIRECRWRKLHNEELHNLYSSPNIIRIIKSRRMRWAGLVARMGEKRNVYYW